MAGLEYVELKNDLLSLGLYILHESIYYTKLTLKISFEWMWKLVSKFKLIGIFIRFLIVKIIGIISFTLSTIFKMSWLITFLIFEPFNLIIRIIDYNVTKFVDFWLLLLFNTKLEKIFTIEYGKLQFKIFVQWIRFINVMIISGLIIGILTYYTSVRIIYWLTKVENKKNKQKKMEKAIEDKIGRIGDRRKETIFGTFNIDRLEAEAEETITAHQSNNSDIYENDVTISDKVDQVANFWDSQDIKPNKLFKEFIATSEGKAIANESLSSHHGEEDDDDIYNYGSLSSLKVIGGDSARNKNDEGSTESRTRNSRLAGSTNSGSGTLFDPVSRGSEGLSDSNQGTGTTTSIFSRLNLTPITTIEEDDEEDEPNK